MLGAGLQFNRSRGGEDRFYNPSKARRYYNSSNNNNNNKSNNNHFQNLRNNNRHQLRRTHSDVSTIAQQEKLSSPALSTTKDADNRHEETRKLASMSALNPAMLPLSNVERFLGAIIPSIPAQYLSKTTMRGMRTCDVEFQPYFLLGDLWESFKEWSAYGAGVPLVLNHSDSVIQYYVPYLSAIQLYVDPSKTPVRSRRTSEDSYADSISRDSGSDGSSDSEHERGLRYSRGQGNSYCLTNDVSHEMESLSFIDQPNASQEDVSSDEGEAGTSRGYCIFEHLERDTPYTREPLADKIAVLASGRPELKKLRSCDLLSSSWISVAWYPIYRIPTGPTLRDLDACFLTYHYLHTPVGDDPEAHAPVMTYPDEIDGTPKISLPVFGLASYKFRASVWISNGGSDRQLVNTLSQAADNWLRLLQVNQPDYLFFCQR